MYNLAKQSEHDFCITWEGEIESSVFFVCIPDIDTSVES